MYGSQICIWEIVAGSKVVEICFWYAINSDSLSRASLSFGFSERRAVIYNYLHDIVSIKDRSVYSPMIL